MVRARRPRPPGAPAPKATPRASARSAAPSRRRTATPRRGSRRRLPAPSAPSSPARWSLARRPHASGGPLARVQHIQTQAHNLEQARHATLARLLAGWYWSGLPSMSPTFGPPVRPAATSHHFQINDRLPLGAYHGPPPPASFLQLAYECPPLITSLYCVFA